tara:strand:- start:253 stop:591 length:339 start_codon:yes stop_codon:yes gene_type:complete
MKLVTAFIQPSKLKEVREALVSNGNIGLTASDVMGFGRQKGQTQVYRGEEFITETKPKTKIECLVEDAFLESVIDVIASTALTGNIGDGKIFVTDVEQVIRIRTGESGSEAI